MMRAIVDKLLSNVAIGYFPEGYIAHLVFPEVKVKQSTGKIGKFNNLLRIVNTVTGGRGKSNQIDTRSYASQGYEIINHALHDILTPEDFENTDLPFDPMADATRALQHLLMLGEEKGLADTLSDALVITMNNTLAGTDQFSDWTNSDPLKQITIMGDAILDACGVAMDTLVMDQKVFNKLKYHPQLFDVLGFKFKASVPASPLTAEQIGEAFGVRRVLVANARYNAAAKGQSESLQPVWGKHLIGLVSPAKAEVSQIASGYRVSRTRDQRAKVFKSPVDDPPDSMKLLVQNNYGQVLVEPTKTIYLLKDVIA